MERCWEIKENRPIDIEAIKLSSGTIIVKIPPMTMAYETWEKLHQSHQHPFSKDDYSADIIGVCGSHYDYDDGNCAFQVRSEQDLVKWLDKYKDIVRKLS